MKSAAAAAASSSKPERCAEAGGGVATEEQEKRPRVQHAGRQPGQEQLQRLRLTAGAAAVVEE